MKCNEVHIALTAYLDEELSSAQAQQVNEHLRSCTECSNEYRELNQLRSVINSSNIRDRAPIYLRRRVSNVLKQDKNDSSSMFVVPTRLAYSLPALLLGLVIGWTTLYYLNNQQTQSDLLNSLTSAHIRSLMVDHLTDIASSDSHTVKPWFHGRLNFSPPVYDLTHYGYPLIGGRLEYIAGDSAAALVYRRRQHTINLFISPKSEQTFGIKSLVHKGYKIIHWNDGGFSYWVISDLSLSDLEHFRRLLNSKVSPSSEREKGLTNKD